MKRADIQGLRAISIISVILYHIWPLNFPNGFLGVDVFFVISGYLIAKCLQNIGTNSLSFPKLFETILDFYKRRIQRIVPIYLGVVCATASISRTIMLESDFQQARLDMYWSLGFVTNLQSLFCNSKDYFTEVFSYRPFLHTWSLGVEIQFYLLSPILMFIINYFGNSKKQASSSTNIFPSIILKQNFRRFIFCSLLLILSLISQQFIYLYFGSSISFGFIFCRLWQFMAGIISYLLTNDYLIENEEKEEKEENNKNNKIIVWPYILAHYNQSDDIFNCQKQQTIINNNIQISSHSPSIENKNQINYNFINFLLKYLIPNIILILLIILLFFPFLSIPIYLRPFQSSFVVIFTSIILFLQNNNWLIYLFLTNKLFVWLGDISYVWYLIHWPTILFLKYFFTIDEFSFKYGIATFILTLIIAFIVEILVDAQIRKLKSFCSVTFLIGIFYAFCFFQLLPTYYSGQNERVAVTKDFDGSLGGRAVTIDVNFTRLIIDDIVKSPEGHSRLANTLSLYEKIRINEILQSATYEDRYKILPGEVLTNRWIGKFAKMVPEERNFLKAVIERKSRGEGKDSTTFLLVGNSHADIISRELQDEFKQNYSVFHMFTAPGCVPFYVPEHLSFVTPDHQMPIKACSAYSQLVKEAIQTIQPDYLFIAFRWYGSFEDQPFNDANNDEILGLINSFLLEIQKNVKIQIFFPAPNLLFKYETSRELAKRLWRGAELEQLHISYKEHLKKNNWSYQRLEHLNCQKCLVYDLSTHFCNSTNDRCAAFDETTKLAIFFDTNHLSYLGRQLARPFLRSLLTPL
uniref:Uncharacterized protein n=1 Tax=Meloidogyne enterolobii TaxID=390850 RepID=A0A6V7U482_MELEN|nr:unnamed protein product [Meloidogyne enterolobii]